MEIYYATTNSGKVQSLQRRVNDSIINIIQHPIDIPEPRSNDVQEIANSKILFAYERIKNPTVVLDAGFYIPSLNGFPRAFVNFALDTIGLEGILKLADGKDRECEFRECLAYLDDSLKEPRFFIGHVKGKLASEIKGTMQKHLWSKLGLIFVPENYEKTLGEMNYEEYSEWSRKSRDLSSPAKQFFEWIIDYKKIH